MRIFIISILLSLISCAQIEITNYSDSIRYLQKIWDSKNIVAAKKDIQHLKLIKDDNEYQTWGIVRPGLEVSPLTIFVNKKNSKIVKMAISLYDRNKNGANFIKSQIVASDWKIIERPIKSHPIRQENSEYSESKGVSFVYERTDPKKGVKVIYWGADPRTINW